MTSTASDPYAAFTKHVNPALGKFLGLAGRDLKLTAARGCVLETDTGQRFDDWVAGFGTFNLGHNPPALKRVIREHLERDPPFLTVENLNPAAGELAAELVAALGGWFETSFFCNSGAEAVEAAIKTAVLARGRPRLAYAAGGYHGTTVGALACMGKGLYRDGWEPLLAEHREVPLGDLAALEAALASGDVAAFLVEPIQVEAGVRIASAEYLRGARELCDRHGALLILDEVQTGMGRTGTLCAFQQLGVEPDMVCLAKALGGGMVPIGATVMRAGLWSSAYGSYLTSEIHDTTFGGNALSCRVALETLRLLRDPDLLAGVRARGAELFASLERAVGGSPVVEEIRHSGLLGGIALLTDLEHPWLSWENMGVPELAGYPTAGPILVERLGRAGILAQVCGHAWQVVRVEPPLVVDAETCRRFVDAVAQGIGFLEESLA